MPSGIRTRKPKRWTRSKLTRQRRARPVSRLLRLFKSSLDERIIDDDSTSYGVGQSGTVDIGILPVPTRGDLVNNRSGNKITITKMRMAITVQGTESTVGLSDIFNRFSIIIGYLKSNNGSATPPTITGNTGFFDTSNFTFPTAVYAPIGDDLKKDIVVLKKYKGMVAGLDYNTTVSNLAFVKDHIWTAIFTHTFKIPLEINFKTTDTDAQASFMSALPFIAILTDSLTTPHPSIQYQTRWNYLA